MTFVLIAEQILNGLQLGVTLFLMSAGLTLIFGVMGLINLAHGSLYMVGAFAAAAIAGATGSFILALIAALTASAIAGTIVEILVLRRLYHRDHLDQVLATFALILIFLKVHAGYLVRFHFILIYLITCEVPLLYLGKFNIHSTELL